MECSPLGSSVHGDSSGKNTGVGCHALLQGIFPTQGLNLGLLHCRQILYHLSHQGSPRILEWVAYPFSRESSWPRNWTRVSCIVGGFSTTWATRDDLMSLDAPISYGVWLFLWLMNCSPPGSSVHGISQARILKGVTMPSSRRPSPPRDQTQVSCIVGRFFITEPPGILWPPDMKSQLFGKDSDAG